MILQQINNVEEIYKYLDYEFAESNRHLYVEDTFRDNVETSCRNIASYYNSIGLGVKECNEFMSSVFLAVRFCPCILPVKEDELLKFYNTFEWKMSTIIINFSNVARLNDTTKSRRYNIGKPRMDLIPMDVIEDLANIYEFGAEKYSENGWLKGFDYSSLSSSTLRHLIAFQYKNEDNDVESNQSHLLHAIWNLVTLYYQVKHNTGTDDRIFNVHIEKA